MGVRVRLRLTRCDPQGGAARAASQEAVALVNSGYEPGAAEIILPVPLARLLGLGPPHPPQAHVETYGSAGGPFTVVRIPACIEVAIVVRGAQPAAQPCDAVISQLADEVVVSDVLGSRLHIAILDLEAGAWAFRHELQVERASEPRQTW